MPASANSTAPQPPAPESVPPVAAAPEPPYRAHLKWGLPLAALAVFAGWTFWPRQEVKNAVQAPVLRTVKVAPGVLRQTLRVSGSTSAHNFANIIAPMMRGPDAGRALILVFLAKSGASVKKGDLIAQIDAQAIKDHVDDVEATVIQADADIRKRKAEHEIELEQARQSIRVTKATVDKAKLDAQASEIRTPIDQELLKISIAEGEAQYQQYRQDFLTIQQRQKAEIRLLELVKETQVRHRNRHKVDVLRFTIKAPMDGLVVMQTVFRGGDMGQIQQGDQVSPGQPFAKVVDTSSMQLEATVNQTASESIRLGQSATVAFDAFPGLTLPGKVVAIGALAAGGWRLNYYVRNIPVRIAIEGRDPRVIPDLSASGDVVLAERNGPVVVPREAVEANNGKPLVYVRLAGKFAPREVEVGGSSNTQVAVLSGLKPGEEIAAQATAVTLNR
jgi:HlyD family secretion protein